jgi:hypothetical protein
VSTIKRSKPPFRVGDLVSCHYLPQHEDIVREVIDVFPTEHSESGWLVSATDGDSCPHCGKTYSPPLYSKDAK